VSADELDDYEDLVDHDEALVTELEAERELSDGEELTDVEAEADNTPFDITRCVYSGVSGNGDELDLRELGAAGALLDDPEIDDEADGTDD
jgi:hypothetical protein